MAAGQRKRKLTASFLEIPEEKDTLKRSWRTGEHSDWTLTVGDQEYKVHKVIVATGERASAFLAAAFRKHLGDADEHTDLTSLLPKQCWAHFEAVLDFIYSEKLEIKANSWGPLVKMADVLQMGTLYTKCIEEGNSFLSSEEAEKHAPRLAIDAVELQLGGNLQDEVIQIAVDLMATCFKGLKTKDLVMQPVEVLQSLLSRDDLEIDNEDAIFDLLVELSKTLSKAHMELLWRCCRLQRLSSARVLEVALINEIPKSAVVWALAHCRPPPRPAMLMEFAALTLAILVALCVVVLCVQDQETRRRSQSSDAASPDVEEEADVRYMHRFFLRRDGYPKVSEGPQDLREVVVDSAWTEPAGQPSTCIICLEPVNSEQPVRRLRCNHQFHPDCILQWCLKRRALECPTCRDQEPLAESKKRLAAKVISSGCQNLTAEAVLV